MNLWHLITKYTIRRCCQDCRKWIVREVGTQWPSSSTFDTWSDAFDYVLRSQTRQYYSLCPDFGEEVGGVTGGRS